jgi:hypothetical protein
METIHIAVESSHLHKMKSIACRVMVVRWPPSLSSGLSIVGKIIGRGALTIGRTWKFMARPLLEIGKLHCVVYLAALSRPDNHISVFACPAERQTTAWTLT